MKQYYCFLERFNNYFNRKIIKFDSLGDYKNASKDFFIPEDANGAMLPFDFNPNDNVMTEIIVNEVPFEPDYFLLMDEEENIVQRWYVLEQKRNRQGQWLYQLKRDVVADNLDNLQDSPVFVQRGMLKDTDIMVTNDEGMSLNQIKTAETLLKDKTNSAWVVGYLAKNAVASDVNITLPVKKSTTNFISLAEISEELGISENSLASLINIDISDNKTIDCLKQVNTAFNLSEQSPISKPALSLRPRFNANDLSYIDTIEGRDNAYQGFVSYYLYIFSYGAYAPIYNNYNRFINPLRTKIAQLANGIKSEVKSILSFAEYLDSNDYNIFNKYNGKTINYLGKLYNFKVELIDSSVRRVNNINLNNYSNFNTAFKYAITEAGGPASPSYHNSTISLETYCQRIRVTLEVIPEDVTGEGSIETQITSSRTQTIGQEFDAFAIPFNQVIVNDGSDDIELTGEYAQRIAAALARQFDASLYDVQLLPYCPFPDKIKNGKIDMSEMTEHNDFDWIILTPPASGSASFRKTNDFLLLPVEGQSYYTGLFLYSTDIKNSATISNIVATVIDPDNTGMIYDVVATTQVFHDIKYISVTFKSTVSSSAELEANGVGIEVTYDYVRTSTPRKIGAVYYLENVSFETTIDYQLSLNRNMKFDSNCTLYRLVSPNYQGTFDFNVAKNGGSVAGFSVACTYKPYTPFIKVAPIFAGLYGGNFGDNRGLICGGDFSLPRTNSAWESYQLNNKNYQNIFNREIQNLEFMQSIERRNQLVSGAVGILTDTAKGAGAGAFIGGATGGLIGGVSGAGASAIGFGIDVDTLARVQRETKQLAIDKFNYQLGNIKALPYTLTKVGAFDIASKIFPFLEFYICSQEEASAFESKIEWESMTVMRIGTLKEFMNFDGTSHYFKGNLIRNDKIADDTHILNAIYEELLKGVYI